MKLFTIMMYLFLITAQIRVQGREVYKIPFGSQGNELELSLFNESNSNIENVNLEVIHKPEWITFNVSAKAIEELAGQHFYNMSFFFDVDRRAKISHMDSLVFNILRDNHSIIKKFMIMVMPPKDAELYQNYPNPFNPSTVISYQIGTSNLQTTDQYDVTLTVFDVLGRELATLVKENLKPGYYEEVFDVSSVSGIISSGIYFYQLCIKNPYSGTFYSRKKMLLLK